MTGGFAFCGRSCMEYGIFLEKAHRILLPGRRQSFLSIAGRNGSLETTALEVYDDITISCECAYAATSMELLRRNARDAARWLSQKGELEFADEPGKFYTAQVVGETPLENEFRIGRFTVSFQCFPFAQSMPRVVRGSLAGTGQGLALETGGTVPTPAVIRLQNKGAAPISDIRIIIRKEV